MGWYDVFSYFYDTALERQYARARGVAAEALDLRDGSVVLDLPTGTGASLPPLVSGVGATGRVVGVDLSEGMVARARDRVARAGWTNVDLHVGDVVQPPPVAGYDRLHVFLGMSVFPDPERAFATLWGGLAPGGRCVIVDVYNERPGVQGKMVEWIARADVRRRSWERLSAVGAGFERRVIQDQAEDGGEMWLATATKP